MILIIKHVITGKKKVELPVLNNISPGSCPKPSFLVKVYNRPIINKIIPIIIKIFCMFISKLKKLLSKLKKNL